MSDLSSTVQSVVDKYRDNPIALDRIKTYINNLESHVANYVQSVEQRQERIHELSRQQEHFCKLFLSRHKYFYLPANGKFYEYDNTTYQLVREDDIHHTLLTSIPVGECMLQEWKFKTKTFLMKRIKEERSLFKAVPETVTIQNVLSFLQSTAFDDKNMAKYFLTVLGDNLLKKSNDSLITFLVPQHARKWMTAIDEIAFMTTGFSITNNFLTRYHESHAFKDCRLIDVSPMRVSDAFLRDSLNRIGVDLLVVAAHYSSRWTNSDAFLKKISAVATRALLLTNHTKETIVASFIDSYLQQVEATNTQVESYWVMPWKKMHYLWKLFLADQALPSTIYVQQLRELLKERLPHKDDEDNGLCFLRVTSRYMPQISAFLQFWDEHMIITTDPQDEYELDELVTLCKTSSKIQVSEKDISRFVEHFFPSVVIEDSKYVRFLFCRLWDKKTAIDNFLLRYHPPPNMESESDDGIVSFDELYQSYHTTTTDSFIVSKQYFERYLVHKLEDFVCHEQFVKVEWFVQ